LRFLGQKYFILVHQTYYVKYKQTITVPKKICWSEHGMLGLTIVLSSGQDFCKSVNNIKTGVRGQINKYAKIFKINDILFEKKNLEHTQSFVNAL
jgi:hypothetical protein